MRVEEISQLARLLLEADKTVEEIEALLSNAKERARMLREETIPSAMQEVGLEELKLSTGEHLRIKQEVYASIPKDRAPEAMAWLTEHNFGGLIKSAVDVEFSREELKKAQDLYRRLSEAGFVATIKESVHPQTLKAFLREQLAAGAPIPLELFGARPVWTAVIK